MTEKSLTGTLSLNTTNQQSKDAPLVSVHLMQKFLHFAAALRVLTFHVAMVMSSLPLSLIRVFAIRMKKPGVLSYPLSAQRRLWSDRADTQADLSLRWAHAFCWFCHVAAHFKTTSDAVKTSNFAIIKKDLCLSYAGRHFITLCCDIVSIPCLIG